MKTCTKCNITKDLNEYNAYKRSKDGKKSICKTCQSEQSKQYYNKTIDYQQVRKQKDNRILSPTAQKMQEQAFLFKEGKKRCLSCKKVKQINDFHKNPQRIDGINTICALCRNTALQSKYKKNENYAQKQREKSSEYYKNNSEECIKKSVEYKKEREKTDELYRLKKRVKRRIYDIMKKKNWEQTATKDNYLGCTYPELKAHIEKQFEVGMTWDNNTVHGWHLDHIIPMELAATYDEAARLNHYTNLRPMWSTPNLSKGSKYEIPKKEYQLTKYELLPSEENKRYILESMLKEKDRIFARKCIIKELSIFEEKYFLNNTHIQGYHPSKKAFGLFYKDELVSLMSFGKPRFAKEYEWEIIRFSSKLGTVVVGGASKLFSHFIKTCNPESIISYCDLRFGTGDVYQKLGMFKLSNTRPGYFYINGDKKLSRFQCMKNKLNKLLPIYLSRLSEYDNMMINGYTQVYDLGNAKFIWIKGDKNE